MARPDVEEWADTLFLLEEGLAKRKTFSCPSYYVGKKMFAFLYEDALGVKCDPDVVKEKVAVNPEVYGHFNPGDGIMKNWLMITYPEANDYDAEREFLLKQLALFRASVSLQ